MFYRDFKNKKGNAITDGITVVIFLFIFSLMGIVGYMVFDSINADIQADPALGEATKSTSGTLYSLYPDLIDGSFIFIVVLLTIFAIVSVFVLDTHPIYFIMAVMLLVGVFIVGASLSNAFVDVTSTDALSTYTNSFPAMAFVMNNLVQVIMGITFVVMIALFAKFRSNM